MTPALQLEDLHCAFDAQPVLRGVEFSLQAGEFAALIGPNGSGKTTLLQCIAGIAPAQCGRVRVGGIDLREDILRARQRLGYAIDPARLPPLLTGRECLALFASARGLPRIPAETLDVADTLAVSSLLDRRLSHCSLGTRQKVGILLGLLGEPPLLLLDEPINGLDPASAWAFKRHLQHLARERGTAVLIATHSLDLAERFATRAMLLVDGMLRCQWDADELAALRAAPGASLEQAMVDVLARGCRTT